MKQNVKDFIIQILAKKGINVSKSSDDFVEKFVNSEVVLNYCSEIKKMQECIMKEWEKKNKIYEIENTLISIPNAVKGEDYIGTLDVTKLKFLGVTDFSVKGLEDTGLNIDLNSFEITGKPIIDGIVDLIISFRLHSEIYTKKLQFIINPNPKDLWKNIPSNKDELYWKEDNKSLFKKIKDKRVVISSKRGRSHQNVGSFRDDDFAFKHFEKTGWSIVVVSDGAGSATLSRKGSEFACERVIHYFENIVSKRLLLSFEENLQQYARTKSEDLLKTCRTQAIKDILYKSTTYVHEELQKLSIETSEEYPEIFEKSTKKPIEFFHSTLIFTVFKKIESIGYVVLTFGVGDCPIGYINKDRTEAKLLNWLDVGEFGGGTRFITQNEIFHSNKIGGRFTFQIIEDFSFLFLMTDGIYDAKFVVESNLEKTEKWLDFLSDLEGDNEDNTQLNFNHENLNIEKELNEWIDFWSKGNHDDRTLAIIY